MNSEIITQPSQSALSNNVFATAESFALVQRQGQLFSSSTLVPKQFQGNLSDCVMALEMASRLGASPLAIMQNIYIVHGKPSWSSTFLIGMINACGRFTPLQYELSGEGDARQCVAHAKTRDGERVESPAVSIDMAKKEGWFGKNGSKWQTMPELMLRYRTATLFARLYAPDLTLGMKTQEEVIDIEATTQPTQRNATPPKTQEAPKGIAGLAPPAEERIQTDEAEVEAKKPEASPTESMKPEYLDTIYQRLEGEQISNLKFESHLRHKNIISIAGSLKMIGEKKLADIVSNLDAIVKEINGEEGA